MFFVAEFKLLVGQLYVKLLPPPEIVGLEFKPDFVLSQPEFLSEMAWGVYCQLV
jgi:hypothetical protein